MEKRRFQRMKVNNVVVDISDGRGFFSGTVADMSRSGLKLDDIPKSLSEDNSKLSIVVSGDGKHFKMSAKPRWARRKAISKKVGLEIVKAPLGWAEFVMDHQDDSNDDWVEIIL